MIKADLRHSVTRFCRINVCIIIYVVIISTPSNSYQISLHKNLSVFYYTTHFVYFFVYLHIFMYVLDTHINHSIRFLFYWRKVHTIHIIIVKVNLSVGVTSKTYWSDLIKYWYIDNPDPANGYKLHFQTINSDIHMGMGEIRVNG